MQPPEDVKPELAFEWLNPEVVMYFGYELYVADDPANAGTIRHDIAVEEINKIRVLNAPLDHRDGQFLAQIKSILISYAGAVKRHKRILTEELHSANEEHNGLQRKIVGNRWMAAAMAVGTKMGMTTLFFTLGYSFANILAGFIPDLIATGTGKTPPSIFLGVVFTLLGTWIKMTWNDRRQAIVENRLNERVEAAWEVFGQGRLKEYRQHIFDLCELFHLYTGREYKVVRSIEAVLMDDLETRRAFVSRKKLIAKSPFDALMPIVQKCMTWRKKSAVAVLPTSAPVPPTMQ